eukprot:887227-Pelagomonas_calceolata.AAC.1
MHMHKRPCHPLLSLTCKRTHTPVILCSLGGAHAQAPLSSFAHLDAATEDVMRGVVICRTDALKLLAGGVRGDGAAAACLPAVREDWIGEGE